MTATISSHRKFLAITLASLVPGASPAKIASLGMVVHAQRSHVGEAEASAGSTVFEGDRLSTDAGGMLRISIRAVTLQLAGQSSMVLGRADGPEANILAELVSGTLVISAAPTSSIVVAANEALLRPAAKAATVANIRVVNRKELRVYALRGALEFSYHGESENIPEGRVYRVLLNPSETEVASLGSDPATKALAKHHTTFILVAIAAAVAAGVAIPMIIQGFESPDRPGRKRP